MGVKLTKLTIAAVVIILIAAFAIIANNIKNKYDFSSDNKSQTSNNNKNFNKHASVEMLVNFKNPIPDTWKVDLVTLKSGHMVDRRAYPSLQKMFDDARALGYNPLICSSYRSNEKQVILFNNKINEYKNQGLSEEEAKTEAAKWVAVPGTSEHQTGLTLDIVSIENQVLDENQVNSACQSWMMEHCYDYGFILRYPKNKTDITGKGFEPWHYRYVGIEAAKIIKENDICLEEYAAQ